VGIDVGMYWEYGNRTGFPRGPAQPNSRCLGLPFVGLFEAMFPATYDDEGLAGAKAANHFRLPRLHPGIGFRRPGSTCDARLLNHLICPL